MDPRILFRTHYQVDEPALIELLIRTATSPVQSSYDEVVASRLTKELKRREKNFNVAAGGYALDLARGLSVVNDQNVWTAKGHLVNLVAAVSPDSWDLADLDLTTSERLMHFRLFLEADGAALLSIASYLLQHRRVPNSEGDWNTLAQDLFIQVFQEYFTIAGTTSERVRLRTEVERLRKRGYTGKTGTHKMFIHLQTMHRLGLINRQSATNSRIYELNEDGARRLRRLIELVPDIYALEKVVIEGQWIDVASQVMSNGFEPARASPQHLLAQIIESYQSVMATGIPLCPIEVPIEHIQIKMLANKKELLPYQEALDVLRSAQSETPSDIRFHVDRLGEPAFLKFSDGFLRARAV